MFDVHIRQAQRTICVEVGSTILQTALTTGIDYPHGCQSGNCGACKSRLHSGEVELSPYSEFALSKTEFDDGYILACRAVPWSHCDVSWSNDLGSLAHPVQSIHARVEQVELLSSDIISIRLSILHGERLMYSPGQFVMVNFEGLPGREYSIASQPSDKHLEFYIRYIEGGVVTPFIFKYLQPQEIVQIEGPFGSMYYREKHNGPILALAGGSGLSAIQPIVLESLHEKPQRSLHLYHGVRDESDIFRKEIFEQLAEQNENFIFTPVLSSPTEVTQRRTGMLHEVLDLDINAIDDFEVYLAGPPQMVDCCVEVLKQHHIRSNQIFADPFFTEADRN